MARFTLRQLDYACAVAQEGGLAQAARSLGVSQPTVAQALDKLESVTGLVLFERHHARGVTLTAQGRQFLDHARTLLEHAAQVERDANALAAHEAGEIRLGCFSSIAPFYLPGLIRTFNNSHPRIRIIAREATLDVLSSQVRDGQLDACLTYDIGNTLEGLTSQHLVPIKPTVLLSAQHPKAGRKSIKLSELAVEPYIMYDAPGSREYFSDLLARAELSPVITYASQSLEGVRSAVAAGLGFSIAALRPPHNTTYEGNKIVAVPISDRKHDLSIVAAFRSARLNDRVLESFVEVAIGYFATVDCSADRFLATIRSP